MIQLKWLSRQAIENMHDEQIAEHGGLPGLRDANALETSLARPLNKAAYGETDIFILAAAYLYAIVRNHPFVDGTSVPAISRRLRFSTSTAMSSMPTTRRSLHLY